MLQAVRPRLQTRIHVVPGRRAEVADHVGQDVRRVSVRLQTQIAAEIASKRGPAVPFDMGPPLAEILKNCKAETGLEPPKPPVFKKVAKMPIYKSKPSMSKLVLKKIVA